MRIAVDAMGGDHAPDVVVAGAVQAARDYPVDVILVGDENRVTKLLGQAPEAPPPSVSVRHASEVVPMGAHPVEAIRKHRDASVVVCARLVKEGEADAFLSAGSTGAAMATAFLQWGRIEGIERPAIGTILPTLSGVCLMLDVGAQVDCRPVHLSQFAVMGSLYAERVLGFDRPKVGLLNNGEEETKGCEVVREAYAILSRMSGLRFIGNIEGRDILSGKADVVVCDGFVGNVVLKFAEGMGMTFLDLLRDAANTTRRAKIGGWLMRPALRSVWKRMDYTEYGGAPLLGVEGVCIIAHGSSNEKAIRNAVRVAWESVTANVVDAIRTRILESGR